MELLNLWKSLLVKPNLVTITDAGAEDLRLFVVYCIIDCRRQLDCRLLPLARRDLDLRCCVKLFCIVFLSPAYVFVYCLTRMP